jgi:hypothetical protein
MGFKEAWKAQEARSQKWRDKAGFGLGLQVQVRNGEIVHGRDKYPLAGARATVDTAGAMDKRVTATRLILTGPFAFGLRKKKDERELFLLVEGDGFGFVVKLDPKKQKSCSAQTVAALFLLGRAIPAGPWSTGSTQRNPCSVPDPE